MTPIGVGVGLGLALRPSVRAPGVLSPGLSSIVISPWAFTANGVAIADVDATAIDLFGSPAAGITFAATVVPALVDVDESTVVCLDEAIPDDGVTPATFVATLVDTDGFPCRGFPASVLSLASNRGATDTITKVGTFTDENGQFYFQAVSSTSGNPVFTLTARGIVITQTATVEVTGPPVGPTLIFRSDFDTLGSTSAARTDGGKWNTNTPGYGEVVLSTGLDFPTPNCYRVPWDTAGAAIGQMSGLGVPGVGATRYYRYYLRHVQPDATVDTQNHPVQDSPGGGFNWAALYYNNVGPGVFQFGFGPAFGQAYPYSNWRMTSFLPKNVTHRYEFALTRLTTTTFRMRVRVYNSANTLLATEDNLEDAEGTSTLTNAPPFTFSDVSRLTSLMFGTSDNEPGVTGNFAYEGAFAVSDVNWCGPWEAP